VSGASPAVRVAVVTYDNAETIADCLDSVRRSTEGLELATAVFDNGSSDGTVELVRDRFPEVAIETSSRNLGFGAAQNRLLANRGGSYALLLNPDAALRPGAIRRLLDDAASHPAAAVVAPRLEYPDGSPQVNFGDFPGLRADLRQRTRVNGARARDPRTVSLLNRELERAFECDWVSGACALIALEPFFEVGGFDETFWLYLEDVDLCRRLRARGRSVRVEPRAVCLHREGGSPIDEAARRRAYRRSRLHYERKHGSRLRAALYRLLRA
jgi:GT2 family glycosyltransferase